MTRRPCVIAVSAMLVCFSSAASSGGRTTHSDVQGTRLTISEPTQLSETIRIRLHGSDKGVGRPEIVRRMQVAVQALRGCRFDETNLRQSGRDFVASFGPDCWFIR